MSTSASTSACTSSTSISPPSRNTRSKRKSVNKENQDPNVDATTEVKTQSNKKSTKNKKQKTSARASASASASESASASASTSAAPSSSSTVSDAAEDVKQEDTPRVRFEKYLNDLGEKYPNHTVMLLESLPRNEEEEEEEEDDEDEESDKEPNASYEDYDKLARIIIPTPATTAYEEFHQQLLDAIDCSDGFVMTWTKHSDIVMDLLQHQLITFNNLSRQIHRSPTTIIPQAFNLLFATTMVMTEFQFWYCDTEEPEACDEMAKHIIKGAWNRLLKRSDQELGFVEARTRTDLKRWLNKSYKEIHQTIKDISGI